MARFRGVRSRWAAVALAVLGVLSLGVLAPAQAEEEPVLLDDPVAAGQLLLLANAERSAAGLPMLEGRYDVTEVAFGHSRRMAAAGDLFHNDEYFTPAVRQRLGARTLGENVAQNRSADDAHRRLMLSPAHRDNLLNPRFTVVGMAVVRTADGTGYITQDFVEPAAARSLAPAPTPAPAEPAPAPAPAEPAPSTPEGEPTAADAGTAPAAGPSRPAVVPGTSRAAAAPAPAAAPPADAAPPAGVPADAAATPTTALETVSVVTHPISSSSPPRGRAGDSGSTTSPQVLIAAAFAGLVMVTTAAARTLAVRRPRGGPTDSEV